MLLSHSPADILRYFMVSLGLGTLPTNHTAWPIHVSAEPDLPDNCITLYDTESVLDGRHHYTGETIEHYGVQIRVRSEPEYLVGYRKAKSILSTLADRDDSVLREVTIGANTHEIQTINFRGGVLPNGEELGISSRQIFTLNCIVSLNY